MNTTTTTQSNFDTEYSAAFKKVNQMAYQQVLNREQEKKNDFQLKDWEFLNANLSNFMPEIPQQEYEGIYHKLLVNHLLSATSFNYTSFESMKYMPIEGNTDFLQPDSVKTPKIFCTYHLGGYRAIFSMLIKNGYSLALIVNQKVRNQQKDSIEQLVDQINEYNGTHVKVKVLEAENPEIGKNMAMSLISGYSILIFLDGNSGVGGIYNRTEKQLRLPFMNQEIYSRTGVATLSYTMKMPVIPIISYYETIKGVELPLYYAADPIIPSKELSQAEYVEQTTKTLYGFLEKYLRQYPQQWECWFFVHKFLAIPPVSAPIPVAQNLPDNLRLNPQFGLFKIDKDGYLFNKKSYQSYPLPAMDFDKYVQLYHLNFLDKLAIQQFDNEWITHLYQQNILI